MQIQLSKTPDATVMALKGRMDAVTSQGFDQAFDELVSEKTARIVLDFNGLEYISSAGLRSVLAAGKKAKAARSNMALCGLSGMVKEVFEISGFAVMLPLFKSTEAAIKGVE